MKTIDINKQTGLTTLLFPDNQPHVNIPDIQEGDEFKVIVSIDSANTLMYLLQVANAIELGFGIKKELHVTYLMGARFDRKMRKGDSHDLLIISDLINSCKFGKVYLYDVHSDVSATLIKNSVSLDNRELVAEYDQENAVLICPDTGAGKKIGKYFDINQNLRDVVYCLKDRDLSNGNITIRVLEPEKCNNRNCVIIDDLCDGGGTFLGIASQIKPKHLTLIVTHAIFSQGTSKLDKAFDEIITTDSYRHGAQSTKVEIIKLNP